MTENSSGSSAVERPGDAGQPTQAMNHTQPPTRAHHAQSEPTRRYARVAAASRDSAFPRVDDQRWGYDPAEVDDFLAEVHAVLAAATSAAAPPGVESRQVRERVFDRMRGGYEPAQVDERLDELEDRLAARERDAFMAQHGEQRWQEHLELMGQTLLGRLNRPHGQRFRRPSRRKQPGYAAADVDVLCDRLVEHFRSDQVLDPVLVRTAVFRQAQGNRSYEEQQVDAFLDRAVELILALESRTHTP